MATTAESSSDARASEPAIKASQGILVALIAIEVATFAAIGTNFLTIGNAFEIVRLSIEIGLLSMALTPVVVTGGIDLSVGSLMGLSAVVFGLAWRDGGLPIGVSAVLTLALGALAGGLNGFLITRLRIAPLIVTLGTFSLFRGLAEGLTGGVDNVTNLPPGFLTLGQGYLFGLIPWALPIFAAVAIGYGVLLHRSVIGRGLTAIGYSAEGARHAGLPVNRWVGLVYVLSGLSASLAALIYVSHLGQAKSDAGTGYELMAITAVVLGGTSIFGGRGSLGGTLLGLLAIAILQNGLRLADLPAELAGISTGILLILAIGLDRGPALATRKSALPTIEGDFDVKNSQVAVLCGSLLIAALLVSGSVVYLARSIAPPVSKTRTITVAMMPKSKGNAYFIACKKGAEEAATELGVNLIWDGPTDPDPAKQNEVVDTWITRGVDVIAVAVENKDGISSVLRKARSRGIKVVTWDSDASVDARDVFVNVATPQGIAEALMDTAAGIIGEKGEFAIITASLTAANMIEWQKQIEIRRQARYPGIKMAALRPCDDIQKKAFDETTAVLNVKPQVRLIMAICSPAVPGAAEAVKQSGRKDVKVIGLGLPNDNKKYVHEGITEAVILWKTRDLGYLAVLAARDLALGTLKPGATEIQAGRLGTIAIKDDNLLLGKPFLFTKENIDQFDF